MYNQNNLLCSNGFREFFLQIKNNSDSPFQIAKTIERNYHLIADELPIAKMYIHLDVPDNILDPVPPDGRNLEIKLCSDENKTGNDFIYFCHTTGDHGLAKIDMYPPAGYTWNENEKKALEFFSEIIFMVFGKSRLGRMMSRTFIMDMLTGAANVRGFNMFGDMLYKSGRLSQYVSMFFNIKNFNYINRNVGSREGDIILRKYVKQISNELESDEEIICRLGGDNFIILVKFSNSEKILEYLKSVQIDCVKNNFKQSFDIRVRAGIYKIQENDAMSDVIHNANIAFHQTRITGNGDYIWFKESMKNQVLKNNEISAVFPKALEEKEFVVYYQPKVMLSNNHLCGCEALVRWFRNGKLVPPMEFIPTLEQEGSICRLDFYVLEQVCRDINYWLENGMQPFCVSVNFSKAHLRHSDFADNIISIIKKYNIDSKYIEVELTETSSYENFEILSKFINRMKENGICTSIDDFGTGYSSLNLLKDLNVDIIKLDKSFLDNLESHNKSDEVLIKHIVGMVSDLNMNIIAEGVETAEQAAFLRSVHCNMAQGYLFDRPLPRNEYEDRLRNGVYNIVAT